MKPLNFFKPVPYLYRKIKVLQEVGLGYITLGQSAVTLSGGEAQRVKLSTELAKKDTGKHFTYWRTNNRIAFSGIYNIYWK